MESLFDDVEEQQDEESFQTADTSEEDISGVMSHSSPLESSSLTKFVPEDDPLKRYTLYTTYNGTALSMSMSDGQDTWEGEVTESELQDLASSSNMAPEEHLADTIRALQGDNADGKEFVYLVTRAPSGSRRLAWKKYLSEDNIKFQLGEVTLHPVSSTQRSHFELCDYAINSISELKRQVMAMKADKQRLISERASVLRRLEECVSLKEDIERELFGKFKVVLNDKKSKIRQLGEQVELLLDENAQLQQKLKDLPLTEGKMSSKAQESSVNTKESTKVSPDTDDEMDLGASEDTTLGDAKTNETLEVSSCGLLVGEEEKEYSPPVKRQRRKPNASRSASGGPVAVPKLTTRKRSTRLTKENSQGSSSSKDKSMESDELLKLL